ncbi:MAG TPA: S8 family serine peptidase [Candidatus Limnocylindrales bacterium]|nr:S8 family serine peptidase [Candidatus Limnocylindrales bacterium]
MSPSSQKEASPADSSVPARNRIRRFPYRLSNTAKTIGELARTDRAILLENALLDTERSLDLPIPECLRAADEPGSYIVQSRAPPDTAFQNLLNHANAKVIAYIPNNAYLVRASAAVATHLTAAPYIQAVIPYEPYYKLQPALLAVALQTASTGLDSRSSLSLNILLFPDSLDTAVEAVRSLSSEVQAIEPSPFGPKLIVLAPTQALARLASLADVQEIEFSKRRTFATDLTRATIGTAADSITVSNYLGLTGSNVLINVNDTGVDSQFPGLVGRVQSDTPVSGQDTLGHGTHVAGIIAGNGSLSRSVTNAPGSILPPVDFQFRGQAPAASILSINVSSASAATDSYLQKSAAQAGALISNNSWHYDGANEYDLAAASYDAAVRDALPGMTGSQPILYVFAGGNNGHGLNDGTGGNPDTIESPATAKNVITVGAVEQLRLITNQTWTCGAGPGSCQTNAPWAAMTDSGNQVAAFSARGNVGIDSEGELGRFKPDVVAPGTFVVSGRSTQWDQNTYYADSNNAVVPSPDANYFQVLSNLNTGLGPFYRFESGTSLAAASVSGTLALMQEMFEHRLGATNSPALLKALLINGARSLTNLYGLSPQNATNAQGWGLIHLPNSLPAELTNKSADNGPMLIFDQNPAQALSTGESKTRIIAVSPAARNQPLRMTLVWTDPPANPVAATKLVNDLDLIVTNLDSGEVFIGNDIPLGSSFNSPATPSTFSKHDLVNNVENVYLPPDLGGNYSVTVLGRRVNVNAVAQRTNDIAQDYALVISSGDCRTTDALTLMQGGQIASMADPLVSIIPNAFSVDSGDFGGILLNQRAGAHSPTATNSIPFAGLPGGYLTSGDVEQWHFYVFTNSAGFSNVAFVTFSAKSVSLGSGAAGASLFGDLDLYVSTNSTLTNLNPLALANADYSIGRGAEEMIVYSNASPGVFYIGVKSESQDAIEYGFLAVASVDPFAQVDAQGNELLRGFSVPALIPGAEGSQPGITTLFALCPDAIPVRRVVVTNTLTCSSLPDLQSTLRHNGASVVLANHSGTGMVDHSTFIYDDSSEGDISGAQHSDGPGNLLWFGGSDGFGQWHLNLISTNQPGTDDAFWIFLERQQDLSSSVSASILPSACREDFLYLPLTTTNLMGIVNFGSGTGPLTMQICRLDDALEGCIELPIADQGTNGMIILDSTSHPPLNPGCYIVRVCNLGPDVVAANITALTISDVTTPPLQDFGSSSSMPIADDAMSVSMIDVTNLDPVLSLEVGVRIDHPRISDLVLRLVSPLGGEVLLDQNRGGLSTGGLGFSAVATNTVSVHHSGPEAVTNLFDTGQTSGVIAIGYNFYKEPDDLRVYYGGILLFDSGLVSSSGSTNLAYGPGQSTAFTIVMNSDGNVDPGTVWDYSVKSTRRTPVYFTFTEDTNVASIPIKFAATPLTNLNYFGGGARTNSGIFYFPEESLDKFTGQSAFGRWQLQIIDTRAGGTNPPPELLTWQLGFRFLSTTPVPIQLLAGQTVTNLLGASQIQWFSISVPSWVSFVTNWLPSSSAPVDLLFNQNTPPTGTNSGDALLLVNSTSNTVLLRTNGLPTLLPGATFYLGVRNTNSTPISFLFSVDFDIDNVISLQSNTPYANNNPGPANTADYYRYVVSSNAVRAQFEINGPTGDVTLLARKGAPPPTLVAYDYLSANPGTNDELIVVYDYSRPVPLSPGEWFLTVVNNQDGPANYTIMATEFAAYGTNLDIVDASLSNNVFCLSWNSLPGAHYFVEGKVSLEDTNWVTLSPTLTASDVFTAYCVSAPTPFGFFRVEEGLVISPPPLLIGNISYGPGGVLLQWLAGTNHQFQVEWTTSISPPQWIPFSKIVTSTTGAFSFLDDGSQSGPPGQARFYQLRQLP